MYLFSTAKKFVCWKDSPSHDVLMKKAKDDKNNYASSSKFPACQVHACTNSCESLACEHTFQSHAIKVVLYQYTNEKCICKSSSPFVLNSNKQLNQPKLKK